VGVGPFAVGVGHGHDGVATGTADGGPAEGPGQVPGRLHGNRPAQAGDPVDVLVQGRLPDPEPLGQGDEGQPLETEIVDHPAGLIDHGGGGEADPRHR